MPTARARGNHLAAVIGLGYVGLPLVISLARSGFMTYGVDTDPHRVKCLANGASYVTDVTSAAVKEALESGLFKANHGL
ncbi:MAG TPA: hypothetical protein VGL40_08265 [Bacillota bacterium]|jgi:UDP-N-acetyl-D-glucosamine dehydrogenase